MYFLQLKLALRNLWRYRLHTGINVLGLAIGISACFAIIQLVRYEYSFDKFHPHAEQIYRLYSNFSGEYNGNNAGVAAPLPLAITERIRGMEQIAPLHYLGRSRVAILNGTEPAQVFPDERGIVVASADYFDVFTAYDWLHGEPTTALSSPFQVVLSEQRAQRYFNTTNTATVIGRELIYRDSLRLTVSGIVANFSENSDLIFEDFISFPTINASWLKNQIDLQNWTSTNSSSQAFIRLDKKANTTQVLADIQAVYDRNRNTTERSNFLAKFRLQPLTEMHFNAELGVYNNDRTADRTTLFALLAIALILLIIAGINFVNLATAQAMQRSKEVGVRKVLGSSRGALVRQFLSETFVLTIMAAAIAGLFGHLTFTWFAEFLPPKFHYAIFEPDLLLYLLLIIVLVSLLAGAYPAAILSSFKPVAAMKQQLNTSFNQLNINWLRKGLIIFQFAVTFILIAGTYIVSEQIQFILHKDLGFAKDAIVYTRTPWQKSAEQKLQFKQALEKLPAIEQISLHYTPPTADANSANFYKFPHNGELTEQLIFRKFIDENYLDLYEIELLAGRNVIPRDSSNEIIINETLAQMMGFSEAVQALNRTLSNDGETYPIVGVVKDFHHKNLQTAIEPLLFSYNGFKNFLSYKFNPQTEGATIEKTITQLATTWNNIYPETPFNYTFYDESIAKMYDTERRTAKLMQTATLIAILISCLGLFGLVSFMVTQRTREIGIRKVLGASVTDIVGLLAKDFLWLVGIAIVIGIPVAYWCGQRWLADYAYAQGLSWWIFGLTALISVGVAFFTVSLQSLRAALINPVDSLKEE